MATDVAETRVPRSDDRNVGARTQSRRKERSASASPRSDRSRSQSRSRERSSRRRRSRSPTSRRKPHSSSGSRSHRSSRRSHRSRSRSASRDRHRSSHRSSRRSHRDRSGSRSRSRGRHGHGESSSRKRRHRERSRSNDKRRTSGEGDELAQRNSRRQRRDSSPKEAKPTPNPAQVQVSVGKVSGVDEKRSVSALNASQADAEKAEDATPTSQESVATSTSTMTVTSSQSDTEPTKPEEPSASTAKKTEEQKTSQAAAKVNVQSIKMDILKALADARSAIAGIKGVAPATESSVEKKAQESAAGLPAPVKSGDKEAVDGSAPKASTLEPVLQPVVVASAPQTTTTTKSISPRKTKIAAADVDEFDIFSAADRLGSGLPLSPAAVGPAPAVVDAAIQSNYDDAEGYYKPSIGEVLNGKYRVMGTVGKGVFSTVLRCQCLGSVGGDSQDEPDVVAIKLIRSNEVMREASQIEIKILTELSERDPRDKKHCVRLLERFEHRNHVALVFEPMQMNVREAMKKFGGKGGISIQAVRIFCKHLLIALTHLESCNVVHADIKPDNVLLDDKQTMIKLCDFGSAFKMHEGSHDPTPYLVSRFYRAPEIVLGLPYDKAVDMWSVGCCLYEMFTGKVMFPGATNNEMLKLFMELKGKVPNKIIKKHRQAYIDQFQMEPHFTEDNKFISRELDRVTNKPILRHLDAIKTRFDLGGALIGAKSSTDDRKQVLELRNLLERMFTLDPAKRITPKEALAHPFVKTEATKP